LGGKAAKQVGPPERPADLLNGILPDLEDPDEQENDENDQENGAESDVHARLLSLPPLFPETRKRETGA
jgi:hypothetical protein